MVQLMMIVTFIIQTVTIQIFYFWKINFFFSSNQKRVLDFENIQIYIFF